MSKKLKHEIKSLTFHEVGMKMDDMLEAARLDMARFDGAKQAFIHGKSKVEELTQHVDKDVQEGLMDPEVASLVKKYIVRSVNVLANLGLQSEVQYYQTQGRVAAFEKVVGYTKGLYDAEKAKMEAAEEAEKALEAGEEDPRRPQFRDVVAERKAEMEAAAEPQAEPQAEPAAVPESVEAVPEVKKSRKKR